MQVRYGKNTGRQTMVLDISVVVIYAAAMLLLGWYGMRRARTQEDFLVAGRNLGPGLYMGTMAATVIGGASTVGTVRLGYVYGISGFWLCAALGAACWCSTCSWPGRC
jgi:SSS family solute:Na+ symporter